MADDVARPRLGRGLAALIGDFGDDSGDAGKPQAQRKVAVDFCAQIRETRVGASTKPNSTS